MRKYQDSMQLGAYIPGTLNSYRGEKKSRIHPQARVAPVDANQIGLLHGTECLHVDCQLPGSFDAYSVHSPINSPIMQSISEGEGPGDVARYIEYNNSKSFAYEPKDNTKSIRYPRPCRARSSIYKYTIYKCIHKLYSQNFGWLILNDVCPGAHIDGCSN